MRRPGRDPHVGRGASCKPELTSPTARSATPPTAAGQEEHAVVGQLFAGDVLAGGGNLLPLRVFVDALRHLAGRRRVPAVQGPEFTFAAGAQIGADQFPVRALIGRRVTGVLSHASPASVHTSECPYDWVSVEAHTVARRLAPDRFRRGRCSWLAAHRPDTPTKFRPAISHLVSRPSIGAATTSRQLSRTAVPSTTGRLPGIRRIARRSHFQ